MASFFWVQSMVRDDGARAILFDLDQAIQAIAVERGHGDREVIRLTGPTPGADLRVTADVVQPRERVPTTEAIAVIATDYRRGYPARRKTTVDRGRWKWAAADLLRGRFPRWIPALRAARSVRAYLS